MKTGEKTMKQKKRRIEKSYEATNADAVRTKSHPD